MLHYLKCLILNIGEIDYKEFIKYIYMVLVVG
jgi:hypothetical protein